MPQTIDQVARRPLSPWTRFAFLLAGVLLPLACFLLTAFDTVFTGEWQSGNLDDKYGYLLSAPAVIPFYPFLLYAIVCLSLLLWDEQWAHRFWIRLGIHTACVVSVPFGFLLVIAVADIAKFDTRLIFTTGFWGSCAIFAGVIIWALLRWGAPWAFKSLNRFLHNVPRSRMLTWQWIVFGCVTAFATIALFSAVLGVLEDLLAGIGVMFGMLLLGSLASAPFWAFAVYAVMAVRIYGAYPDVRRFGLIHILAVVTWLGAYLAAWRLSVRLALEQYTRLPTEPPDGCYVCSTAARGHHRWVQSQVVKSCDGRICVVNDQMRYLKAAELAVRVSSPSLHRRARWFYDRIGPQLASRLHHPLAADVAYSLMKPAEWAARIVLTAMIPSFNGLARQLYTSRTHERS